MTFFDTIQVKARARRTPSNLFPGKVRAAREKKCLSNVFSIRKAIEKIEYPRDHAFLRFDIWWIPMRVSGSVVYIPKAPPGMHLKFR